MSVIEKLRKGFGYFLLSVGISRPMPNPEKKPPASSKP
jgi:hypothetical protein